MKKFLFSIVLLLLVPRQVPAQEKTTADKWKINTSIPAVSQYSDNFVIKNVFFNKRIDTGLKGEFLEVEFMIESRIDDPQDLYIFVIATYEQVEKTKSSFERPVPRRERVRTFVPFPDDLSNFSYPVYDENGNVRKGKDGKELTKLVKFPKNPKAGVDPKTGKPYHLVDKLQLYTMHLSKYRQQFFFYNNIAILVFDADGKPVFRQLYEIKGKRNR